MANSNTEHSKKLRAKTAAAYNKRMIAEGKMKFISLNLTPEIANAFDAMAKENGLSRRQAFELLWQHYQANKNN